MEQLNKDVYDISLLRMPRCHSSVYFRYRNQNNMWINKDRKCTAYRALTLYTTRAAYTF